MATIIRWGKDDGDRDRGRPLGRCPFHTTRHAGPHRAVREVEVVDGYGQSPQAFLFYVPPNELHHELSRVGLHPSLLNPPQLPELLMPCTFERHNFRFPDPGPIFAYILGSVIDTFHNTK